MKKISCLAATAVIVAACGTSESPETTVKPRDFAAEAQRIAVESLIVDTHIDVPFRVEKSGENVVEATEKGDFDYPRATAGGLNAAFMSIYTPASHEAEGRARQTADALIAIVEGIVAAAPDKLAIARTPADVRNQFDRGILSLPLGMENGSPIEGDLAALTRYRDRGISYITLTHGKSNHISDSSYDDDHQWQGLSDFGKNVVKEMNRLGIMIDISHVSDDAFWQVIELSETPVIASHSSARHFTPGFERNMSDEMIAALAEHGGVIQINFGSSFITQAANEYQAARMAAGKQYAEAHPDLPENFVWEEFPAIYAEEHGPFPYATLDDVLDHFDHVVRLAGIDHVGIGSDFDGVGDSLPEGLKDVSAYPNLIEGLLRRGYSEDDIRKLLGLNLLRVWEAVERYAAATTSSNT